MLFVPPSIPFMVPEAESSHGAIPNGDSVISPADWAATFMANVWDFRGVPLTTDASFVIQRHTTGVYSFELGSQPGNDPATYGINVHHVWIDKDTPNEIFSWWDHESGTCITGSNFEWHGFDVSIGYESTCSSAISVNNPQTDVYKLQVNAQYLTEGEHTFKWTTMGYLDQGDFVAHRTYGGQGESLFLIGEYDITPPTINFFVNSPLGTVSVAPVAGGGFERLAYIATDSAGYNLKLYADVSDDTSGDWLNQNASTCQVTGLTQEQETDSFNNGELIDTNIRDENGQIIAGNDAMLLSSGPLNGNSGSGDYHYYHFPINGFENGNIDYNDYYLIHCKATDPAGNSITESFVLTILPESGQPEKPCWSDYCDNIVGTPSADTTPPVIAVPNDITLVSETDYLNSDLMQATYQSYADYRKNVVDSTENWPPTAVDDVDGNITSKSGDHWLTGIPSTGEPSFGCEGVNAISHGPDTTAIPFAVLLNGVSSVDFQWTTLDSGVYPFWCYAIDSAGNQSNETFYVTVTEDPAADTTPAGLTIWQEYDLDEHHDGCYGVDQNPHLLPGNIFPMATTCTEGLVVSWQEGNIPPITVTGSGSQYLPLMWGPDCSPSRGSHFPIGDTTVTCIAADQGGTLLTVSFTIRVFLEDLSVCSSPCFDESGTYVGPTPADTSSSVVTIEQLTISEFYTGGELKIQYFVAGYYPNPYEINPATTTGFTMTKEIIKPDGTMGATNHESHGVLAGEIWYQSMGYVLDPFNGDGWTMKVCIPEIGECAEQNFNISFASLVGTTPAQAAAEAAAEAAAQAAADAAAQAAANAAALAAAQAAANAAALAAAQAAPEIVIPDWIKFTAGWWNDGSISDSTFVVSLQWLITNGIMTIPPTDQGIGSGDVIPGWIKMNAGWWNDGSISDSTFVNGLQWLITNGVMVIG